MTLLANMYFLLTDSASQIVYVPYEEAYEEGFEDMQRRVPDITKAHEMVGFQPTMALDEIICDVAKSMGKIYRPARSPRASRARAKAAA